MIISPLKPYQQKVVKGIEKGLKYGEAQKKTVEYAKYNNAERVRISDVKDLGKPVSKLGATLQEMVQELKEKTIGREYKKMMQEIIRTRSSKIKR